MSLTREEVEHIAHLARLELTQDELDRYQQQLSSILEHVSNLQALDTETTEPMSSIIIEHSRLREDNPGECLTEEELLRNAPDSVENQFRVPPVLDHDSS
ncbi:MAG: Asp-tRNA(Asn)/Glu-tRNA(Gln) amidotransferase subunit GatC [Anaerolineae bacterium]|nr:Asp-tRNA(Asn)/Glu-tRNA(Gln) amidotransferase subunit GatC [Anaerolineae bacterium]